MQYMLRTWYDKIIKIFNIINIYSILNFNRTWKLGLKLLWRQAIPLIELYKKLISSQRSNKKYRRAMSKNSHNKNYHK